MPDSEPLLVTPAFANVPSIIKIIGVGGGGGNAVGQMYRDNIPEVRYMVCNTDHKALENSPVPNRLQLGPGLGAGGDPRKGRELAEENVTAIENALDPQTRMLFITAGMGGGTGTGASPVIAREARKRDILTVGIVTIPFLWERERQIDKALDGLDELAKEVDAILVINNERLREIYPDLSIIDAFKRADQTLSTAVSSITEIISMHGRINLDFEDVRTVLTKGGVAVMSTGHGEGENRVTKAIHEALNSPLLNNKDVYRADRMLIAFTTSEGEGALLAGEMDEITDFTAQFSPDLQLKWGLALDNTLGRRVKVTILASGFSLYGKKVEAGRPAVDSPEERETTHRREKFYNPGPTRRVQQPRVYLFSPSDLLNEQVLAEVERTPTHRRTGEHIDHIKQISQR